jgi:ABC-type multidrug transport system ATPase subunit
MRSTCQRLLAYHFAVTALLACSSLRVDVDGTPAIDGLTVESTGRRVLVLGAARALFEAAAGLRSVEHGELLVAGQRPVTAIRGGLAAAAPLDPPMPARWTVFQYIDWSARLSGLSGARCDAAVEEAIHRLELRAHSAVRLGKASAVVRRGTVIGAALATGADAILIEDPMVGLPSDVERGFGNMLAWATEGRRILLFAGRVALDSAFAIAADEAIVVDGSGVLGQGNPTDLAARGKSFAVRVAGDVEALATALAANGCRLQRSESPGDGARFTVDLGSLGTRDLLRVAEASHAVVLELRPLTRVFA